MIPQELRLGNLVYIQTGMNGLLIYADLTEKRLIKAIQTNCEGLKPIPLTEEWLVKFGFEKYSENNLLHFRIKGFMIVTYLNENVGYYWLGKYYQNVSTKIQYVHQLQNLYFSLCGEELELSPVTK